MKRKMKRKYKRAGLLLLCVSVLSLSVIGGRAAYAYFIHKGECANPFTVGENTIVTEEEFDPPVPGEKTVKEPRAVNTGKVDCYVRAKVLLSDNRVEPFLTYMNDNGNGEGMWIKNQDGWFYYDGILGTSQKTEPIFTHIMMEEDIPQEFQDVVIDVMYESVQAEGFENAEEAFLAIAGKREDIK